MGVFLTEAGVEEDSVGIDYSLFIVSRYREERTRSYARLDAIIRAGATATQAVVFSGLTVVLTLVGMLILPNTLLRSPGIGTILFVSVAVAASMTVRTFLVPASMRLLGNLNWYFPSRLEWIPNISVEGHVDESEPEAARVRV